jgi:hypothetical protein
MHAPVHKGVRACVHVRLSIRLSVCMCGCMPVCERVNVRAWACVWARCIPVIGGASYVGNLGRAVLPTLTGIAGRLSQVATMRGSRGPEIASA